MSRFVTPKQRQMVGERAKFCCEYCRLPEADSYIGFQADHIVSWKHGGPTISENLAYACADCNRNKGTDLGTLLYGQRDLTRFFNPRTDGWDNHFGLEPSGFIEAVSDIGRATVKILEFNHPDRVIERALLVKLGVMSI